LTPRGNVVIRGVGPSDYAAIVGNEVLFDFKVVDPDRKFDWTEGSVSYHPNLPVTSRLDCLRRLMAWRIMSPKLIHNVPLRGPEDEELVVRSRTGDVGAFRGIATRYYSLIYTMAYEATGSSNQSDELARDTFVAAWRRLSDSREPIKLRSWLCALAPEFIVDYLRHRGGHPV